MALNLCVMEILYDACPLSRPSELKVSFLYVHSICSIYLAAEALLARSYLIIFFE